jgi:hypothetical protein
VRHAKTFTVRQGRRYRAELELNGFESMASNQLLARKLEGYGFSDPVVSGKGRTRIATATWVRADATAELPKQIVNVLEIKL